MDQSNLPPFDPSKPVKQGNVRTFTTVKFGFWERIQVLFGVKVLVQIDTNLLIQEDEIKSTNAVANVAMESKMFWKLEAPVGQMSHKPETPYDTAKREVESKEKPQMSVQKNQNGKQHHKFGGATAPLRKA